jgi:hypothetical protein
MRRVVRIGGQRRGGRLLRAILVFHVAHCGAP